MDALLINIVTNEAGQSPFGSGPPPSPGDGETAFAEALSAAMAASMQTAVKPDQHRSGEPVDGERGRLLATLKEGVAPSASPDLTATADRSSGGETQLDAVRQRLHNPSATLQNLPDLPSPSSPAGQVPGAVGAIQNGTIDPESANFADRRPGAVADLQKGRPAGQSVSDRSSAALEGQLRLGTGPIQPPAVHSTSIPAGQNAGDLPIATTRQQVSLGHDRRLETPADSLGRRSSASPDTGLTSPINGAVVGEPGDQRVVAEDANQQTARLSGKDNPGGLQQPAIVGTRHPATIEAASASVVTETAQARPQGTGRFDASMLDIAGQRDLAKLLAVLPEGQTSGPSPSPSHRFTKPLADGALPLSTAEGVSAGSQETSVESDLSPVQRVQPSSQLAQTPATDTSQKPMASILSAVGAEPTAPANPADDAGFVDSNRAQTLLAADGAPLDGERFEPATAAIASSRSAGPPASAAPGAQIGLQIARSLANGVERLTVHLNPAELGSVDIQLNFEDSGRLTAQIVAERPETLELLQRDSRLLERSLGDNGLRLTNDGLSFSLKQDQQQQQAGQQFQQRSDTRQTALEAGQTYDDTPAAADQPQTRRVDGLRLLDIRT
jgi:flagellar hook-length control protein FliK